MRKRITSLLLTLMLMLTLIPTGLHTTAGAYLPAPNPNTPHTNNGWVEIYGPYSVIALREYLKDKNNTWYMRLTGNLSLTDEDFYTLAVNGTKYLDLNGYTIDVDTGKKTIEDDMFHVSKDATLVVCDSRGGGRIHYDGRLSMVVGCESNGYSKWRRMRHLFDVEGTMILNGGELDGGRSKEVWVTYSHEADGDGRYTGYARQQLYADGIKVRGNGSLLMNGGSVCGRGKSQAAIRAKDNATVLINGGRVLGFGEADALKVRDKASITIRSGYFETRKIDKEHCGQHDYVIAGSDSHYVYQNGTYGDVGVTGGYCYPGAKLSTGSHSASVTPPSNVKSTYVQLARPKTNIYNPNIENSGTVRLTGYTPYYTEDNSWGKLFEQQYLGTAGTGYTPYYTFAIYDRNGKRVSDEITDVFAPGTQPSRSVSIADFKNKNGGTLALEWLKPYTLRCTVYEFWSTTQDYTASYYSTWNFMQDIVDMRFVTLNTAVEQAESSRGDMANFKVTPSVDNSPNASYIQNVGGGSVHYVYFVNGSVEVADRGPMGGTGLYKNLREGEQRLRCEYEFASNGIPYTIEKEQRVYVFPRVYASTDSGKNYSWREKDEVVCPEKENGALDYVYLRPYTSTSYLTSAGRTTNDYVWQYRSDGEWKDVIVTSTGTGYQQSSNVPGVWINSADGKLATYRSGDYRVMMNFKNVKSYSAAPITVLGRDFDAGTHEVSLTASKNSTEYNVSGCTLTAKFNLGGANWDNSFKADVILQREGVPDGAWGTTVVWPGNEFTCITLYKGNFTQTGNRVFFDSEGTATFDLTRMNIFGNVTDTERIVPGTYRFVLKVPYTKDGKTKYVYSAPCVIQVDKRATGVDIMLAGENLTNGGGTSPSNNTPRCTMPGDQSSIQFSWRLRDADASIPKSPTIKWSIYNGLDLATFDQNTGRLTAKKPGTVTVRLSCSGSGSSFDRYVKVDIPIEGFLVGQPDFGAAAAAGRDYGSVTLPITHVRSFGGSWVENTNSKYMSGTVIGVEGQHVSDGGTYVFGRTSDTVMYNDKFVAKFEIKPKDGYQFILYTTYQSSSHWEMQANSKMIQCNVPGETAMDTALLKGYTEVDRYYNGSGITPANAGLLYPYEELCLKDPTGTVYLDTVFITTDEPKEGDRRYGGDIPQNTNYRNNMLNVRINTIEGFETAGGYPVLSSTSRVSKVPGELVGTGTAYAPVQHADMQSALLSQNPNYPDSWMSVLYDGTNPRTDQDLMRILYAPGTYVSELTINSSVAADGTRYCFAPNVSLVINGHRVQLLYPSDNGTFSPADVESDEYGYQFLGYTPSQLKATYYIVADENPAYNTATVQVAPPETGEQPATASDAAVTGVTYTGDSTEIANHGVYVRRLTWFLDENGNGRLDDGEECTAEHGLSADGTFLGGAVYSAYIELAVTEGMGRLNNEAFTLKVNALEVPISTTAAKGVCTFGQTEVLGYAVTGQVTSYNPTQPVQVKLMQGSVEAYEANLTTVSQGNGKITQTFSFGEVAPGTYDLVFIKEAHLQYKITGVKVLNGAVDLTQHANAKIKMVNMIVGDVNGNGVVDGVDLGIIWNAKHYG